MEEDLTAHPFQDSGTNQDTRTEILVRSYMTTYYYYYYYYYYYHYCCQDAEIMHFSWS